MQNTRASDDVKKSRSSHSSDDVIDNIQFVDEEQMTELAIKDHKVSFRTQNIVCSICLVITSLVFVAIGLVVGVVLYGIFDIQYFIYVREAVLSNSRQKTSSLQQRIDYLVKGCDSLVGMLQVKSFPTDSLSYEEFLLFSVNALNIASATAKIYEYLPYVTNAELDNFVASVRNNSQREEFTNFTITQNGMPASASSAEYFPSLYVFPQESLMNRVGSDIYSIERGLIDIAIANPNQIVTSPKLALGEASLHTNGFRLFDAIPTRDFASIKGVVSVIVSIDELFVDFTGDPSTGRLFKYYVNDQNETLANNTLIFESTTTDNAVVSAQSRYTIPSSIKFGNRYWTLTTIPTTTFVTNFSTAPQWIAMLGCFVACFFAVLTLILVSVVILNLYRTHIMTKSRMQIVLLAQDNLKKLINRISNQEQQARHLLDSIHDSVLIVNPINGKIITANKSFSLVYQFEEEELRTLHINSVLPNLHQDFFSGTNQLEQTESISRARVSYKVQVAQTPIPASENCMIVMRLLVNDEKTAKFNQLIMKSKATLESCQELLLKLQQPEFHSLFRKFCKQEFTLELLDCIVEIEEYKTILDAEKRIKMQKEIITTYLLPDASKQVNLSSKVSKKVKLVMTEALGHVNCFDFVEKILLETLYLNSYTRFKEVMSKMEQELANRNSIIIAATTSSSNSVEIKETEKHQTVDSN